MSRKPSTRQSKIGKSIDELAGQLDTKSRYDETWDNALERLGEGYLLEGELREHTKVPHTSCARMRDRHPDKWVYVPKLKKRVWSNSPETIAKVREMIE